MSWMQMLCDTYDYAVSCGAACESKNPLPEFGFVVERAGIEVRLDKNGHFTDATDIPDEDSHTVTPCTPESGVARGAPVKPHPLFDKAKYLGTPEQMALLGAWCAEPDTPEVVQLVYAYLDRGALLGDLDACLSKKKIKWSDASFVRFCVADGSDESPDLWRRGDVMDSWRRHFQTLCANRALGLCYATGKSGYLATKHPFGTGTAMLVSMMDQSCAGRFESCAEKAVAVGLESTMKAHSTRKWLLARQGTTLFGLEFVAWDTRGFSMPNPFEYDPDEEVVADTGECTGMALAAGSWGRWTGSLGKLAEANRDKLGTIVLMAVDCATTGRASIVYYQEFEPEHYIENLTHWYNSCKWTKYAKNKSGQWRVRAFTPKPQNICDLLYERGETEGQKKLKKQLVKELLPCIAASRRLPETLVMAAFHKTVNPLSFKGRNGRWDEWGWKDALAITCALFHKHSIDKGDEHTMSLNESKRDLLFGCLLAVADEIERRALEDENDRPTNAMRYMQRFQQRPATTWMMLRTQKLKSYIDKLDKKAPGTRKRYYKKLAQIEVLFAPGEIADDSPLGPRFLEGFSNQTLGKYNQNTVDKNTDENYEEVQ